MSHWTVWEWIAYATLWISAIIVAVDGGLKMSSEIHERVPRLRSAVKSPWWAFAPVVLIVLASILLVGREVGWLGPSAPNFADQNMEQVINKTFKDSVVDVDDKEFVECLFEGNVTFRFEGKRPFRFTNSRFAPQTKITFTSSNPVVSQTAILLNLIINLAGLNTEHKYGPVDVK